MNKINKHKKNFFLLCFLGCMLSSSTSVFAYPDLPTMDSSWGFTFKPVQVTTRYWKYGDMDWSNAVNHAKSQLSSSPANVSINVSANNSYNDCKIRLSSNYWTDVSWVGNTSKESSNVYKISLNSSKVSTESLKKSTATHEICHAFGLNDCAKSDYIMYGYDDYEPLSITTYENNLFIKRYGEYK